MLEPIFFSLSLYAYSLLISSLSLSHISLSSHISILFFYFYFHHHFIPLLLCFHLILFHVHNMKTSQQLHMSYDYDFVSAIFSHVTLSSFFIKLLYSELLLVN